MPKKDTIHTPIQNKSIGAILKEKRDERALSIPQVSEATKIRKEFIAALEKGDYTVFASEVYARGFLRNYASFLGIDSDQVMALYRRENQPVPVHKDLRLQQKKTVPANWQEKLLTRRNLTLLSVVLIALLVVFYLINQATALMQPPMLQITAPVQVAANFDGEILVAGNSFKIAGKTAPQTVVRMNAEPIELQANNEFTTDEIPLKDSETTIIFTGTNQFGRTSTITLKVKKGGTGIATTTKMSILIEVKNQASTLLVRTDGVIQFNDSAFPGDIISLEAKSRVQVESETPGNISVNINGTSFPLDAASVTWELVDGKIIKK